MAIFYEADERKYMTLLHATLRKDKADEERSTDVMLWIQDNGKVTDCVLSEPQLHLLGVIQWYFRENKTAPTRIMLDALVAKAPQPQEMQGILMAYDGMVTTLQQHDALSLPGLVNEIAEEYRRTLFMAGLKSAEMIVTSGMQSTERGAPEKRGLVAARAHLLEELQSDIFHLSTEDRGGSFADRSNNLRIQYDKLQETAKTGGMTIPTYIDEIDNVLGGFQRQTVNGILGYTGHRKSGLLRSVCYNMAFYGQRVLYIPFEFSFDEEQTFFAMMHAQHSGRFIGDTSRYTVTRFREGLTNPRVGPFSPQEEADFFNIVVPDLERFLGDNLIIRRPEDKTWNGIKALIEGVHAKTPLDVVAIDYFTLMDPKKVQTKTDEINAAVIHLKQFALALKSDHGGVAIITPIQGSRKGLVDAQTNGGVWESTGIYMYSEMEKTCDCILYAFYDDDLRFADKVRIGTVKTRRTAPLPPVDININPETHYINNKSKLLDPKLIRKDSETSRNTDLDDMTFRDPEEADG